MKTVSADLSIKVLVECPHCEYMIDLLDDRDTSHYNHNDEGQVMRQACPDGNWMEAHKKFSVKNVECTSCSNVINIKGLNW